MIDASTLTNRAPTSYGPPRIPCRVRVSFEYGGDTLEHGTLILLPVRVAKWAIEHNYVTDLRDAPRRDRP
jgi:hypothetical protein